MTIPANGMEDGWFQDPMEVKPDHRLVTSLAEGQRLATGAPAVVGGWGRLGNVGDGNIDEITWRFVLEATIRTAVLQTGEAQIAEDLSYADVAALEKNADVRILRGVPAGTPWTIFPNVQRFPTNDPAVRRALHHAINKDAVARVVFHGQSHASGSLIQPPTPGFVPVAKELFPYDPARAKKILDGAGWKPRADGIRVKDGKRLEILWIFGSNNGYVVGVRKEVAGYAFNVVTFPVLYDVSLTR